MGFGSSCLESPNPGRGKPPRPTMSTWSASPLKALWTASTILQTLSMPPIASLVNRLSSSMLSCAPSPPIWSHCVPNAANLALENVAQKTINYLPNLVKKCASHHTETSRRINPKWALSSCHSALCIPFNDVTLIGCASWRAGPGRIFLALAGVQPHVCQMRPAAAVILTRPE